MAMGLQCLLLAFVGFTLAAAQLRPARYNFNPSDPAKCPEGSRPDDLGGCIDDDECRSGRKPVCPPNSNCFNTQGSFFCECYEGYKMNNFGYCVDADECRDGTDACTVNENCVNELGSYACYCKAGFVRDFLVGCRKIGSNLQHPKPHPHPNPNDYYPGPYGYPPPRPGPYNGYPYPPPYHPPHRGNNPHGETYSPPEETTPASTSGNSESE